MSLAIVRPDSKSKPARPELTCPCGFSSRVAALFRDGVCAACHFTMPAAPVAAPPPVSEARSRDDAPPAPASRTGRWRRPPARRSVQHTSSTAWSRPGAVRLAGRVALWLVLGVVLLTGARTLVAPARAAAPASPATTPVPSQSEVAFATRFAIDYLTYDGKHPELRARALAAYLPTGTDPTMGWDGVGQQSVSTAVPVSASDVADGALVTVAVETTGGGGGAAWRHLVVHITRIGTALVVGELPRLAPAPMVATAQPTPGPLLDADLGTQLRPTFDAFFRAYGAGSDLTYYLVPGVKLRGLGGVVTLSGIASVAVAAAGGDSRTATVRVRWTDATSGGSLEQEYVLQLRRADGRWYVESLLGDQ